MMSTDTNERRDAGRELGGPELPQFLEAPLTDFGLMAAFHACSPYEQDVFLEWITSAEGLETRDERIANVLDALALGGLRVDPGPDSVDFVSPHSTHHQEGSR
jgi:hypothetical protein